MDTSETFVRKIRAKYKDKALTDYRLAKLLGMSPQGIHSWKSRGSVFDDKAGEKIADLLGLDPAYVLMCLSAERSKDEQAKKTYERIAKVFQYAARTVVAVVLGIVLFQLPQVQAKVHDSVYYVKRRKRSILASIKGFIKLRGITLAT